MSLASNLASLVTRIGTEFKSIRTVIGSLNSLATLNKSSIVAAINEVFASVGGSGATINDVTPSTTSVYSSSKVDVQVASAVSSLVASSPAALDTLNELAGALANDPNFATTITTALGNRVRVDAEQNHTSPQKAQARANIDAQDAASVGDTSVDLVAAFNTAIL